MARTDKDRPYAVKTQDEGIVHHDHRKGRCVVGTYKEYRRHWNFNSGHREVCPRFQTVVTCIHDGERIRLQAVVDHARAAQRSHHVPVFPWNTEGPVVPARGQSSDAIRDMLNAGRIPNCIEAKTHRIDIEDIDLRLIPGESVEGYHSERPWMRYRQPEILRARYDDSIRCKVCEADTSITCWLELSRYTRRHSMYYCGCHTCEDDGDQESVRTVQRDKNRKRVREYNTYGDTE